MCVPTGLDAQRFAVLNGTIGVDAGADVTGGFFLVGLAGLTPALLVADCMAPSRSFGMVVVPPAIGRNDFAAGEDFGSLKLPQNSPMTAPSCSLSNTTISC